jgi:hypothetical protein
MLHLVGWFSWNQFVSAVPRYVLSRNVVCVKILFEVFDFLLVITVMSRYSAGTGEQHWQTGFNWINQADAATSQVYYLSFKYSSTCFGHPHAHHQELQQLQYQHLLYRRSDVKSEAATAVVASDVYCAVRTGSLNKAVFDSSWKG